MGESTNLFLLLCPGAKCMSRVNSFVSRTNDYSPVISPITISCEFIVCCFFLFTSAMGSSRNFHVISHTVSHNIPQSIAI